MSDQPKTFYLTTPIYYVNARPHIGHAYTTIVADVLARRHRLLGDETFFLTGTDEHGQKIERSAAAAGIPPQQFADQVSIQFRNLWDRMGLTYDRYIRTTDPQHKRGAQKLFAELYERGAIYLSSYTGQYCVSEEIFVEGPPGTIGPDGKPTETVTEENFFFRLSDYQLPLIDLIESNTLAITPEARKNEVLSFLRGNIVEARTQGLEIATSAAGAEYVKGALRDLSVSRSSFTWGIPVPEPAASATEKKHVMYVWLDALANYMTALGYGNDDTTLFDKFWPADVHIMAKEITRQHCIYWPAFLLAANLPLPKAITAHGWLLFDNSKMSKSKGNVVRTETILDTFGTLCPPSPAAPLPLDSTGLQSGESGDQQGGALAPGTALKGTGFSPSVEAPKSDAALAAEGTSAEPTKTDRDLFAADVLRYYLLREIPFGQDGSFAFEALITRYNADLANGYGNLVSRTLSMIQKYFDGEVPAAPLTDIFGIHGSRANEIITKNDKVLADYIEKFQFNFALEFINDLIAGVDRFITTEAPWKLAANPEDRDKLSAVLGSAFANVWIATARLHPILPYATARVWAQLGLGDIEAAAREGKLTNLQWGGLQPGTKLGPLGPIFPRADKGLAQIMTDLENPTPAPIASTDPATTAPDAPPRAFDAPSATLPVGGSTALTTGPDSTPLTTNHQPLTTDSPQITIDDFAKIDLRVAQITLAERIPKADKLLRLEVDLGPLGTRQILSGIAEFYTPEELTGRRIVVITNLAPRKMRGLESHGMLLAASDGDHGKPHLATCGEDIALGSRLK